MTVKRESMEFDVVIVGAGPAGLSASIKLMQLSQEKSLDLNVCVLEKGSDVGAHIISGAVIETRALDELLPDWESNDPFKKTAVTKDQMSILINQASSINVPTFLIPGAMNNHGNYITSVGSLCRWLAAKAESMGVNIFPGFPAVELIEEEGAIVGVISGDMGLSKDGQQKEGYEPGYELRAKYTIFSEGCRGNLGKQLIKRFELDAHSDSQHYGIGFKEVWNITPEKHQLGSVLHTAGWPLDSSIEGGGFVYHAQDQLLYLGLIVSLDYQNPNLSPFGEFQKWKSHPKIKNLLEGGERISYGARAVNKGGLQSLPKLTFPGGLLVGCDAGFLNGAKIKGTHTAMKSGMLAAESIVDSFSSDVQENLLEGFEKSVQQSWVYQELYRARNFSPAQKRFGLYLGSIFIWLDQNIFRGRLPMTLHVQEPDYSKSRLLAESKSIDYPKPDGVTTFDRTTSIYLSGVAHEEDQPCHLYLTDPNIPIETNLPKFGEPAQLYCPAGVYELVESSDGELQFQINAQNCIHCKTCDIKDPSQNIVWKCPEGGGGPNYTDM
ncbi:MAG TPA: electron transfer flavoprotein-ubiquinone oxidoreductase [Gammaproteobacteria bacterium]|nr:electron transfer flavoprotein-ubiquinone oxidoreductase [Gammaproteobacteria bacterium]